MAAEEDVQVLMELGDENINFVAEESIPHKHLVFRIVNTLGDESTALANMAVMFRGTEVDLICVEAVFLAVKKDEDMQRVGTGAPDEDDTRVFRIEEWTSNVPLPLGNDLLSKLRIVIKIDDHLDPGRVKFGADLVPFPEMFLQGSPKMKRKLGSSTLKFKGGTLTDIENAMSALTLESKFWGSKPPTETAPLDSAKETVSEKRPGMSAPTPVFSSVILSLHPSLKPPEYWWTSPSIQFKQVTRV